MLEDATEHQQATLGIISLLLVHGGNSDELYTPVSNNSLPRLCMMKFLRDEQWFLDLAPCVCTHVTVWHADKGFLR